MFKGCPNHFRVTIHNTTDMEPNQREFNGLGLAGVNHNLAVFIGKLVNFSIHSKHITGFITGLHHLPGCFQFNGSNRKVGGGVKLTHHRGVSQFVGDDKLGKGIIQILRVIHGVALLVHQNTVGPRLQIFVKGFRTGVGAHFGHHAKVLHPQQ